MRRKSKTADPRLLLYKERNASECMNAAFDFMRQNWRILLRYSIYIQLPVCIIQTVGIVSVVDAMLAKASDAPLSDMFTFFVLAAVGFVLLNAMLWTMFKLYHDRPDGLATVTGSMFRKLFWPMLWRMTIAFIPIVVIMVPALALSTIIMLFMPIAFFVYMVAALPVLLIAPIYALEDVSIFTAIRRAFVLGFRKIGVLLLMAITLYVMVYVMQGITLVPMALLGYFRALLIEPTFALGSSPLAQVMGKSLFNLSSVVFCYVSYLSVAVVMVSGAYLYGTAVQQGEDRSILADIDNFENL